MEFIYNGKQDNTSLCNKIGAVFDKSKKTVYCVFMDEKKYKSNKQNDTFHALLKCFWDSGCSSFDDYSQLRRFYKKEAGLIVDTYEPPNIPDDVKRIVYMALKILPIKQEYKDTIYDLLKGKKEKELSWSYVLKENATRVIDKLQKDMDFAGVNTNKYEEILKGLNQGLYERK